MTEPLTPPPEMRPEGDGLVPPAPAAGSMPGGSDGTPPPPPSRLTIPAVVLQFFIFPLALVVVCALLFLFVGWLTHETRTPEELLKAIADANTGIEARRQAAAEFARILEGHAQEARARRHQPGDTVVLPPEIEALGAPALEAFRNPPKDDTQDWTRFYLATALGLLRYKPAAPVLTEALGGATADLKIPLLAALGNIGDPSAVPALLPELSHADAGVRKQAAFSLGLLRDRRAVAPLQARLQDPAADVRWNAAVALTRFADDPAAREAARPVLREMLDTARVRQAVASARRPAGSNPAQYLWKDMWEQMTFSEDDPVAETMINAMRGVLLLQDRSFEERLAAISEGRDEIPRVREFAMRALRVLRETPRTN